MSNNIHYKINPKYEILFSKMNWPEDLLYQELNKELYE